MCMRYTDAGHITVTESARTDRPTGGMTSHSEIGPDEVLAGLTELGIELAETERDALRDWLLAH